MEVLTREQCYVCKGSGETPYSGAPCITCVPTGSGYIETWVETELNLCPSKEKA
ncbi:hypothetical protein LCGC14_1767720 [marine sediment metagenome]|uniref:Uncharacterized protein n=1 Tax=marine sediment metagenome TaxID=412755 RepID=A0A0F9GZ34_9ZZZZ